MARFAIWPIMQSLNYTIKYFEECFHSAMIDYCIYHVKGMIYYHINFLTF